MYIPPPLSLSHVLVVTFQALPQVYIVSCLMSTPAYGFALLFLAQYLLNLLPGIFSTTCALEKGGWACTAQEAFYWVGQLIIVSHFLLLMRTFTFHLRV